MVTKLSHALSTREEKILFTSFVKTISYVRILTRYLLVDLAVDHIVFEKLSSTFLLKIIKKTEIIKTCGTELARHNIYDQSPTQVKLHSHYPRVENCSTLSNSSFIYLVDRYSDK